MNVTMQRIGILILILSLLLLAAGAVELLVGWDVVFDVIRPGPERHEGPGRDAQDPGDGARHGRAIDGCRVACGGGVVDDGQTTDPRRDHTHHPPESARHALGDAGAHGAHRG